MAFETEERYEKAMRYVTSIKNPRKQEYARRYLFEAAHGHAEPDRGELSYMAAQAVRIELHSIFGAPFVFGS